MRVRPVKIKDVADEAGVSTMTVSRVLNKPEVVSEDTRIRVQETIRRLGFYPNAIARSLKARRTYALGLVTVDLTDSFFTNLTAGAEAEARRQGYRLVLSSTEHIVQDEPDFVRLLAEQQVDGILIIRDAVAVQNDPLVNVLNIGIPIVTTGYHFPHPNLEVVDVDNVDGGYKACRFLLECGHRKIGMITGPTFHKSVKDRMEGYHKALAEYGLDFAPSYICEGDWSSPSGYIAMKELLDRQLSFSAVFVQSDAMAIGAYRAIYDSGFRIPEDISVIGYDDLPVVEYIYPPLTSMRQPVRQIGELAVKILIRKINGESTVVDPVILQAQLIERCSVSKIPPQSSTSNH
jgi:DNA-binding LacI/PurR family transcriptional regulator